jgi:hypothetical protein
MTWRDLFWLMLSAVSGTFFLRSVLRVEFRWRWSEYVLGILLLTCFLFGTFKLFGD